MTTSPHPPPLLNLEIATFTLSSALLALSAPTPPSRIELCTSSLSGGLTPPLIDFLALKTATLSLSRPVPINVMIRPHAKSFNYTTSEIESMVQSIAEFKNAGTDEDGFVFGCLDAQGLIDEEANRKVLDAASPRPCTFHRAFDDIPTSQHTSQLEILINLGFTSLLSSGGSPNALQGKDVLKKFVEQAAARIEIIIGGGVRQTNLSELKTITGARWYHSSAVVDAGEICDEEEIAGLWRALRE